MQVDLVFYDEPKIVYNIFYKIKDTSIFASIQFLELDTIVGCTAQFVDYLLITG